ncbi:chloramphenicol phosphotransferase CPT family protein [Deinococcus lacus]|uniref:Chloramphenicol phosphotransferase CPT family protein n=1 Tax=Deinococcus lacus TaxID=392561 RepID=A0ABW1YAV0_9DEIO
MMPGSLILLNGASCAGKSTLCRALQTALPEPFLFFSMDFFLFGQVLPRDEAGKLRDYQLIRPQVFQGFYNCLPALLDAGNNLVVETILENAEQTGQLQAAVRGYEVFWVGIQCPVSELERREQARGDRRVGDARRDAETVHTFVSYDLELHCTDDLSGNVARVVNAWQARQT